MPSASMSTSSPDFISPLICSDDTFASASASVSDDVSCPTFPGPQLTNAVRDGVLDDLTGNVNVDGNPSEFSLFYGGTYCQRVN